MSAKHQWRILYIGIFLLFIFACASPYKGTANHDFSLPQGLYGHAVVNNGEKLFVFGGSGNRGFTRDIYIVEPNTRTIEHLSDTLLPRRYHSAVWDGQDSIYILGGVSLLNKRLSLQPSIEVYDIPSKKVTIIGEMPVPRRFGSAVFIDGKIIVSGGEMFSRQPNDRVKATDTVAIYDISANTWKKGADLPYPQSTRTVVLNQEIYAIGGFNGSVASDHFARYNYQTAQWLSLPALPQVLSAHSVVANQGKIYTFGDYQDLSASYVYDATLQTWQKTNFNYQPSRHNAATVLNNIIYVIGGNIGPSGPFLNTIQTFPIE